MSLKNMCSRTFLPLIAALVGTVVLAGPSTARADLTIRLTTLSSSNVQIDQFSNTVVANPQGTAGLNAPGSGTIILNGGFSLTSASMLAGVSPGSIQHSLTVNFNYTGPTGPSNKLVVEFLGTNYNNLGAAPAFITSNGSPSTAGATSTVTMYSGASATNDGLPVTASSTAPALAGLTTGTGPQGSGSSGVLSPNPATGASFTPGALTSFYQKIVFDNFTAGGLGSISAGSTISNVPAPAGIVLALAGAPFLAVGAWIRRRKAAQTA